MGLTSEGGEKEKQEQKFSTLTKHCSSRNTSIKVILTVVVNLMLTELVKFHSQVVCFAV